MPKLRLALLAGGISSEREVSLNGGEKVYEVLDKAKYDIRRYDPKTDLDRIVADAGWIDVALIILHGPYGEDGTVQGLLDLLKIPYQGAGVLGSALAMNKKVAKLLYQAAGLPVAPYRVVDARATKDFDPHAVVAQLGLPVVVKPVAAGSSMGMSIVREATGLLSAVAAAALHDDEVMIEAYIKGIEITAGVLGNDTLEALPLIEIVPGQAHAFFDYKAKYTAGLADEICPARLDQALTAQAQEYALGAHRILQCRGYSRTDMMVKEKRIYLLETNTIPGMTATSLLPQAARVAGYSFSALLDHLIQLALEDRKQGGLR